jgi:hypothetical protein
LQPLSDITAPKPGGCQLVSERFVRRSPPGGHLPVGEPRGEPVRGMHRERRFADTGHPADRLDAHHTARGGRRAHQLPQFEVATGERGDVTRQRPRRLGRHVSRQPG